MLLADAAPSGAGLAIVAVIFLVFIAMLLGMGFVLFRVIRGRNKPQGLPPAPPHPEGEQQVPTD